MTEAEILAQLEDGARIIRVYQAFEGDYRVIVRLPGVAYETRYTIRTDKDGNELLQMMP